MFAPQDRELQELRKTIENLRKQGARMYLGDDNESHIVTNIEIRDKRILQIMTTLRLLLSQVSPLTPTLRPIIKSISRNLGILNIGNQNGLVP